MKTTKVLAILVLALGLMVCLGQEASGGTLAGWGYNGNGQTTVPAGDDYVAVAGGEYHSLALKSDGTLEAWGRNTKGQCDVPTDNDFVAISAGFEHSFALKSDGSLAAWGDNSYGQCDVPAGNDFVAIAAGGYHCLALKDDASVVAWGWNASGQCDVPPDTGFIAIAGGQWYSLALKSDGSLAAWGDNFHGQTDVPAGTDFVTIAAGSIHGVALKSDGTLSAWGNDDYGQVSDKPADTGFVTIAAGYAHGLALKPDGSLAAWGGNYYGQTDVPPDKYFVATGAGGHHSLAITAEQPVPMGTAFTYQGRLLDEGSPAEGLYDFKFKLYNANVAGTQQGSVIDINDLDVIDGQFAIELDFGSEVFEGMARWLEIGVRPGDSNDPNAFVTLSPRQELTPTPYAIYAKNAPGDSDWVISVDNMYSGVSGNVGIGTPSPQAKLSVGGDGIANTGVYGTGTGFGVYGSGGTYGVSGNGVYGVYGSGSKGVFGSGSTWGVQGTDSDTSSYGRLGYDTWGGYFVGDGYFSGNVGIGTTSPTAKLHIGGTAGVDGLRFPDGTLQTTAGVGGGDNDWIISGNNMYSGVSGNVGIGTTEPTHKLTVEGSIKASDGVYGYDSDGIGVWGESGEEGGWGVYGRCDEEDSTGVVGDGSKFGVRAYGDEYGVFAISSEGTGIYAKGGGGSYGYAAMFRGNVIILAHSSGETVMELGEGLDYAEGFDVSDKSEIAGGTVLIIDSKNPGKLAISDKPYDSKVAGIVAGAKGQGSGVRLGSDEFDYDVALAGRVYCNVDATEAGVEPGDLLTTSAKPGYAMKATDYMRTQGAILGKAMEKLEKGKKGQILVLVTLQ